MRNAKHTRAVCSILAFFGLAIICSTTNAIDFGQHFKGRRRMRTSKNDDVEAHADEVLSYTTACDRQLAKSMYILGEQKTAAEEALNVCKQQRGEARSDIEFLVKKVDLATKRVEESDERLAEQLNLIQSTADAQVEEVKIQLAERETAIENLKMEHANELEHIASLHEYAVRALVENNAIEIEKLQQENHEKVVMLKNQMEKLQEYHSIERTNAKTKLETLQTAHENSTRELEKEWKALIAKTESSSKQTIEHVETKLSSCKDSLRETKLAKESVERDYERARQRIAVLENVTAVSLAMEDAKDLLEHVRNEVHAVADPIYESHLKDTVEKVKEAIEEARPYWSPATQKMSQAVDNFIDIQKDVTATMSSKIQDFFVVTVCRNTREFLKDLKRKEGFKSTCTFAAESVEDACNNPTEFLTGLGTLILVVSALLLRKVIYRTVIAVLLLPVRILLLPVRILLFPLTFFTITNEVASEKFSTKIKG